MISYPNLFDPVETNGVYANGGEYDILTTCKNDTIYVSAAMDIEKLTAAARSKEILVNVPKLKIEKVENEMTDITKASMDELTAEIARRKENEQLHLNHDFYKRAAHYREMERYEQIIKGAHKYPTPFEPMEWTPKQLLQHAMQENVDQAHYIYGLYEHVEELEMQIRSLTSFKESYQEVLGQIKTIEEQRDWEKNKADKLEKQVGSFQAYKESHGEMLAAIGRLTKYLITEFPEAGKGTDWSIDVAIELLKDYKKAHNTYNETRKHNIKMLEEHNSLGKYLTVHYPQMLVEGETAISITKRVMDAYRKGEEFAKKQF